MEESAMIEKIGRAQDLAANGDRDGARPIYADMWAEATHAEERYQECVIISTNAIYSVHLYFT